MEKQYEEVLNLLKELEEGMTPEMLGKLSTEQMCHVIDQMAKIKGQIAVLKNEKNEED